MMKLTKNALLLAAVTFSCSVATVNARLGSTSENARQLQEDELRLDVVGDNGDFDVFPLGLCQGECDFDSDCAEGLMCFQRARDQPVPGCQDRGPGFDSRGDYCVPMPIVLPNDEDEDDIDVDNAATALPSLTDEFSDAPASDAPASDAPVLAAESESTSVPAAVDDDGPLPLTAPGNDGEPADVFPLGECQGDCDNDAECGPGLICWERNRGDEVPGCTGGLDSSTDFCVKAQYGTTATYVPTLEGSPEMTMGSSM